MPIPARTTPARRHACRCQPDAHHTLRPAGGSGQVGRIVVYIHLSSGAMGTAARLHTQSWGGHHRGARHVGCPLYSTVADRARTLTAAAQSRTPPCGLPQAHARWCHHGVFRAVRGSRQHTVSAFGGRGRLSCLSSGESGGARDQVPLGRVNLQLTLVDGLGHFFQPGATSISEGWTRRWRVAR